MRQFECEARKSVDDTVSLAEARRRSSWRSILFSLAAAALGLMSAPAASALSVDTARVRFDASRYGDNVTIRGKLDPPPQSIETFASIRIDVATFSETIDTSRLVQSTSSDGTPRPYYRYAMEVARKRAHAPGIRRMTLNLETGRFTVELQYLSLQKATNPMPLRIAAGLSDQCVMLQFSERPAYTFAYDYDDEGDPILSSRRVAVNGNRPAHWTFLRNAGQPGCGITDLEATPRGFSVNSPARVLVEARLASPVTGLQVFSVDDELETVAGPLCTLRDDGSNGDAAGGDRIYSCRLQFFEHDPTILRLIAKGTYQGQEVASPRVDIDVVPEIHEVDTAVFLENMYRARDLWGDALARYGNTAAARKSTAEAIHRLELVREVAVNDDGFLIEFAEGNRPGILGLLPVSGNEAGAATVPPGGMSAEVTPPPNQSPAQFERYENVNAYPAQSVDLPEDYRISNTDVVFWAPFYDRFFPNDELNPLRQRFASNACPNFTTRLERNTACTLESVRRFARSGTVILATEGFYPAKGWELVTDRLFEKDPVFATGENATAIGIVANVADMTVRHYVSKLGIPDVPARKSPRLTLYYTDDRGVVWGVKSSYVRELTRRFPESVVFAGFRNSSRTQQMAQAFLGNGASSYLGFTNNVRIPFIRQSIDDVFHGMLDGKTVGETFAGVGHEDPGSNAALYLTGDARPTYKGLVGLQNGDFERSTASSWEGFGDFRTLTRFGPYFPPQGSYMGMISTGLGDIFQNGELHQTGCVAEGQRFLRFDWNFLSAEFRNWCNQGFNDRFLVRINDVTAFERGVDALCSGPLVPLLDVVLSAPDEDVWATGWQSGSIDLSPFTGGHADSIDVDFAIVDDDGSLVDSAVLLDRIRIE